MTGQAAGIAAALAAARLHAGARSSIRARSSASSLASGRLPLAGGGSRAARADRRHLGACGPPRGAAAAGSRARPDGATGSSVRANP